MEKKFFAGVLNSEAATAVEFRRRFGTRKAYRREGNNPDWG